jgi:hypothetical protein
MATNAITSCQQNALEKGAGRALAVRPCNRNDRTIKAKVEGCFNATNTLKTHIDSHRMGCFEVTKPGLEAREGNGIWA